MPAKPAPKKAATAEQGARRRQQARPDPGRGATAVRTGRIRRRVHARHRGAGRRGLPLIVYHFETKQNLYRALFERFRTLLDARLTALHAPVAPGVDPLEHIVRALVLPVVQAQGGRPAWPTPSWWPGKSDPREAERGIVAEYFDPFAVEFVHAIRTVLPRQDPDYAHWAICTRSARW